MAYGERAMINLLLIIVIVLGGLFYFGKKQEVSSTRDAVKNIKSYGYSLHYREPTYYDKVNSAVWIDDTVTGKHVKTVKVSYSITLDTGGKIIDVDEVTLFSIKKAINKEKEKRDMIFKRDREITNCENK